MYLDRTWAELLTQQHKPQVSDPDVVRRRAVKKSPRPLVQTWYTVPVLDIDRLDELPYLLVRRDAAHPPKTFAHQARRYGGKVSLPENLQRLVIGLTACQPKSPKIRQIKVRRPLLHDFEGDSTEGGSRHDCEPWARNADVGCCVLLSDVRNAL